MIDIKDKNTKNCYDIEKINAIAEKNLKELIDYSENIYQNQIVSLVDKVIKNKSKIILLTGPSSSGKTTSSNLISKELLKRNISSFVVSIDDFFIDLDKTPLLEDGTPDMESINAVDLKTFNKFIYEILHNHKTTMPKYNFNTHKRDRWEDVEIDKNYILIIEGIHALNPNLIAINDFEKYIYRVYACVDSSFSLNNKITITPRDLRLMRRTYRDSFSRNRKPSATIKQWKYVCEGEDLYISPYKQLADTIVDTTHPYEILVYGSYLKPMLSDLKNSYAKKLLEILNCVKPISKNNLPENSMIWEFLGNKE